MDLKQLLEPMEYKMRAGPGGNQLAYIDARQAQDKLDEVCGPENWKIEYKEINGKLFAGVSIKPSANGFEGEWITKWDGGTESNIEKEKGLISDSFKRACVCWGIGRFLYSLGAKKGNDTQPIKQEVDLPWYNDFDKHIDFYVTQIKEGQTSKDIITNLTKKYKVNKKIRQSIEDLETDNK